MPWHGSRMDYSRWCASLSLGLLMSGACADDPEPAEDEAGTTTEELSAADQQAACLEAVETYSTLGCTAPFSFFAQVGGGVEDLVVISLEEARYTELPHGHLLESDPAGAVIGDDYLHNERCLVGCLVSLSPGTSLCQGVDSEGVAICGFIGASTVAGCEELTDTCAGQ